MSYEEKFARAEASGQEGVFTWIDEAHPVGIFLGLEGGDWAVLIVCPAKPPDPPPLVAIRVDVRARNDSTWALVLRLARRDLKGLFTHLVEDLDGATRQTTGDPGKAVVERLTRWQRLLSRGTPGVLEGQELRGLAAELDFLLTEAIHAVGARAAVSAWKGPYEAPKDFLFDHAEVEVKAVHRQQRRIRISSLEQLSDSGLPLYLWSRVVDLDTGSDPDTSIAALVERVRVAVGLDAVAAEGLELGLRSAGYEDRPEYDSHFVRFGPATCCRVSDGFPRIQRVDVAPGVLDCSYDVDFNDLAAFRVASWKESARDGH
jgi:hypothetical protein